MSPRWRQRFCDALVALLILVIVSVLTLWALSTPRSQVTQRSQEDVTSFGYPHEGVDPGSNIPPVSSPTDEQKPISYPWRDEQNWSITDNDDHVTTED